MLNQVYLVKIESEEQTEKYTDVLNLWLHLKDKEEGELYIKDIRSVKIQFDTRTGEVTPVSADQNLWVTSFYSPTSFQIYLVPIVSAISLLSKQKLLRELAILGDDHIAKTICQRHEFDHDGKMMTNTDLAAVNKTFLHLLRLLKPSNDRLFFGIGKKELTLIQQCVFDILIEIDFYEIKSKNDVSNIIKKIKMKIAEAEKKNKVVSR